MGDGEPPHHVDHGEHHREEAEDADERRRVGYATSFMYSPVLQRHIALARIRPDLATPGVRTNLEFTINHRYVQVGAEVARTPLFDPDRKTSVPTTVPTTTRGAES